MKIFWTVVLTLITSQQTSSTVRISVINNAMFDPTNAIYLLTNISNIKSRDSCICQCYAISNCITISYYGYRRECKLFSTSLQPEQIRVMSIDENGTVVSFDNRNHAEVVTTESSTITSTTTSSSTVTSTTTGNVCTVSTSPIRTYTTSPASSYGNEILNYQASFTGIAILEFGFKAQNSIKVWHVDDVSIIDTNTSNSQMLVNGGFESGSLTPWQVACSSTNCAGTGGFLDQSDYHTGNYSYEGACRGAYDFLRQSLNVVMSHVYVLSFWIKTAGNPQQAAYVDIRQG